jgi:riboflavin biosynthesis pyrimidine reductase
VIVRRVYPEAQELDADEPAGRARLLELYSAPSSPWLRLNFVASVSGSAGGADSTSETLTNRADRRILGVIRELSDVVLIGAGSLRAEGYLRPTRTRLAVVTTSGDLEGHALVDAGEPLIVLCPPSALERVHESVGVPIDLMELPEAATAVSIVDALHSAGLVHIVCEGGPTLARQLVESALVDELCLTTSAVLNGADIPILGHSHFAERRLTLAQLLVDESSATYARWLL